MLDKKVYSHKRMVILCHKLFGVGDDFFKILFVYFMFECSACMSTCMSEEAIRS